MVSKSHKELQGFLDKGERVEAAVVSEGKLMSAEEASIFLEEQMFKGIPSSPCPVYVWTNKRVIYTLEYDGQTCLMSVPRNPTAGEPEFCGDSIFEIYHRRI